MGKTMMMVKNIRVKMMGENDDEYGEEAYTNDGDGMRG